MRVYSKAVGHWDEASKQYVLDESSSVFMDNYTGPVAFLKESDAEKSNRIALEQAQTGAITNYYNKVQPWEQQMYQSQMDTYTKQAAQQKQFQDQYLSQQQDQFSKYMDLMNQAYSGQKAIQDQVTGAMSPYLSGNKGFTPEQMTALNTRGMMGLANNYQDAAAALKASYAAHGGSGNAPMGGIDFGNTAEMLSGQANARAGMVNTNQLANYQQALENAFRSAGVMMGVSGQQGQNVGQFEAGGNSALAGFGAGANNYATPPITPMPGMPQPVINPMTKTPSFWDTVSQGFAKAIPGLALGAAGGGLGMALGGLGAAAGTMSDGTPMVTPNWSAGMSSGWGF